jgi:hypothetical protein
VSGIVGDFKKKFQSSDIDSVRELAVEAKKQGLTLNNIAARMRLHNFFDKSEAAEDQIESFIVDVSSCNLSPEKVIELVNQLHEISKTESIPLDKIPSFIKRELEEKQKVDQEIKAANDILQNKTVTMEAINEHIQLKMNLTSMGELPVTRATL